MYNPVHIMFTAAKHLFKDEEEEKQGTIQPSERGGISQHG